jgi:dihydrofolate synthase/folylpolyglutamate synthase
MHDIDEIINYLEKQKSFRRVEDIKNILFDCLKIDIDPSKVIIVAGTNGKGTTCATLQTLLLAAEKNVGFFSSPHLEKINERIKFNGVDISDKDFCRIFHEIRQKITDSDFSYFEYLTLIAAYYFFEYHKTEIDYAIFEVGLGGTLDSTNAIPHDISVITKVGLDHEDVFGHGILNIIKNKFGIISQNNTVFYTDFYDVVLNESDIVAVKSLMNEYTQKCSVKFIKAYDAHMEVNTSNKIPTFSAVMKSGKYKLKLMGKRAVENSMLAVTVFDHLMPNSKQYLNALEKVHWPGRMEKVIYNNHEIFISGDHNPQGIQSLLDILKYCSYKNVHFVVGICKDKDHSAMLDLLTQTRNSNLYLTATTEKVLPIDQYDQRFTKIAKCVTSNQLEALEVAISNASASHEDLIIVTGSLYLVGHIRKHAVLYAE